MLTSTARRCSPDRLPLQRMRTRVHSAALRQFESYSLKGQSSTHLNTAARNPLRVSDKRPRRHWWSLLLPNPTAAPNARADTSAIAMILLLVRLPRAGPVSATVMRSLLARRGQRDLTNGNSRSIDVSSCKHDPAGWMFRMGFELLEARSAVPAQVPAYMTQPGARPTRVTSVQLRWVRVFQANEDRRKLPTSTR